MEKLSDYYPEEEYEIIEKSDKDFIDSCLKCETFQEWGQGKIGETGYFLLSMICIKKPIVYVCKIENLPDEYKK